MIKKRTCGGAVELNLVSKIEVFQDVEAGKAEPKHDKKKRQKISRHDAIFICKRNLSTVYMLSDFYAGSHLCRNRHGGIVELIRQLYVGAVVDALADT